LTITQLQYSHFFSRSRRDNDEDETNFDEDGNYENEGFDDGNGRRRLFREGTRRSARIGRPDNDDSNSNDYEDNNDNNDSAAGSSLQQQTASVDGLSEMNGHQSTIKGIGPRAALVVGDDSSEDSIDQQSRSPTNNNNHHETNIANTPVTAPLSAKRARIIESDDDDEDDEK
jgi:hypothetical protein